MSLCSSLYVLKWSHILDKISSTTYIILTEGLQKPQLVNLSTAVNLNTIHTCYILDQTLQNNGYQSLVEVTISDIRISAVKSAILVYFKVLLW
jgi:hypothetical protein